MKKKLLLGGAIAVIIIAAIIFLISYQKPTFKKIDDLNTDISFEPVRLVPTYQEYLDSLTN